MTNEAAAIELEIARTVTAIESGKGIDGLTGETFALTQEDVASLCDWLDECLAAREVA